MTSDGGLPLAWIENTGNAATLINLSVIGIPEGWLSEGPTTMAMGAGETRGVPISLIPPSNWDGAPFILRIAALNEEGDQRELMLSVTNANFSLVELACLDDHGGGSGVLKIHGTGPHQRSWTVRPTPCWNGTRWGSGYFQRMTK